MDWWNAAVVYGGAAVFMALLLAFPYRVKP